MGAGSIDKIKESMKNILGAFYGILISLFLMAGCNSQTQPTITPTVTFKPMATSSPIATPTFLPPPTLAQPLPTKTPLPLPKGIFELFPEPIFDPISVPYNRVPNHDDIIKTAFGVVRQNSMVEENVLVDSTMGYGFFSLFWEEGDLDLTLIQPDGNEINPFIAASAQSNNYYISFISDPTRERYDVLTPLQVGIWKMRIFGKSTLITGSNYMIQVTSIAATSFSKHFDKEEYVSGDIIKLSASIEDNTSGSLLTPPQYVHGVSMQVIVEDPAKKQYSFILYDDGRHGDGKSDDGIYANAFSNTLLIGKYNFYLQISGKNNRDKQPFTREYFFSTVVK